LTVKQVTTIAIPETAPKPWICRIADEITASPMLDATIASQENDVPRANPISALSATRIMTELMGASLQLGESLAASKLKNAFGVAPELEQFPGKSAKQRLFRV
jgi:hypothetical protein